MFMLPRRVRFDSIDVHPTEKALIIFYDIYVISYHEDGSTLGNERKECQKLVRLQSLNSSTDIIALSKEVLHQCKLIPAAKLTEVQQLLNFLRERPERVSSGKIRSAQSVDNSDFGDIFLQSKEEASLAKLDHYIELLYEDINAKNRGTSLILQLAKERENLDDLSRNESLLHALTRVIREDGRKHYSVAINITFVFLYFASYSQFHELLVKFKVGSMIVSLIEWELQRYDQWQIELQQTPEANLEDYQRKVRTVLLQQTLLLRTCFYILLHLAEDPIVEDKMRQKNIAALLVRALQRRHNHNSTHELIYLVLTFLQKLSIFNENKTEFERLGVVEKAAVLLEYPATYVRDSAARVLYNLSFDPTMRTRMGRLGILPSLIRMMAEDEEGNNSGWALVYNISMDDRGRALIARTECFAYVLELLTRNIKSGSQFLIIIVLHLESNQNLLQLKPGHTKKMTSSFFSTNNTTILYVFYNMCRHESSRKIIISQWIEAISKTRLYDSVSTLRGKSLEKRKMGSEKDPGDFLFEDFFVLFNLSSQKFLIFSYELLDKWRAGLGVVDRCCLKLILSRLRLFVVVLLANYSHMIFECVFIILEKFVIGESIIIDNNKVIIDTVVIELFYAKKKIYIFMRFLCWVIEVVAALNVPAAVYCHYKCRSINIIAGYQPLHMRGKVR
nr:EOG090X049M [Eulimnadia texana]